MITCGHQSQTLFNPTSSSDCCSRVSCHVPTSIIVPASRVYSSFRYPSLAFRCFLVCLVHLVFGSRAVNFLEQAIVRSLGKGWNRRAGFQQRVRLWGSKITHGNN